MREAGIKNISVDLMYGLPTQSLETWEESINGIIALNPEHISAYCLSVEEESPLRKLIEKGKLSPADEDLCLEMAELLRKKLKEAGYIQYEISNYSKPGFESKHNSSYWDGTPYLGLGPGAHSYDGKYHRRWNIGDLNSYLKGERKENGETLSDKDLFNETIMLGLRTNKGVSASLFENIDNYCNYKGDNKKIIIKRPSKTLFPEDCSQKRQQPHPFGIRSCPCRRSNERIIYLTFFPFWTLRLRSRLLSGFTFLFLRLIISFIVSAVGR